MQDRIGFETVGEVTVRNRLLANKIMMQDGVIDADAFGPAEPGESCQHVRSIYNLFTVNEGGIRRQENVLAH